MEYKLTAPMTREQARQLRCGDTVLFTGTIYTARDAPISGWWSCWIRANPCLLMWTVR